MTAAAYSDTPTPIVLKGQRGDITAIYHPVAGAEAAVMWIGGIDGGLDGPANALYPALSSDLVQEGIASVRIALRVLGSPGNLPEALHDILTGIAYLEGQSHRRIGLVGHSFGGAAVIAASVLSPTVMTVVSLSSQMGGTERVAEVSPRPLLLIHGEEDQRLPAWSSRNIYDRARQPKELVLLPDARHSLSQKREEVRQLIREWLVQKLRAVPIG